MHHPQSKFLIQGIVYLQSKLQIRIFDYRATKKGPNSRIALQSKFPIWNFQPLWLLLGIRIWSHHDRKVRIIIFDCDATKTVEKHRMGYPTHHWLKVPRGNCSSIVKISDSKYCTGSHHVQKFRIGIFDCSATKMVQKHWQATPCTTGWKFQGEMVALKLRFQFQNFRLWCYQMPLTDCMADPKRDMISLLWATYHFYCQSSRRTLFTLFFIVFIATLSRYIWYFSENGILTKLLSQSGNHLLSQNVNLATCSWHK